MTDQHSKRLSECVEFQSQTASRLHVGDRKVSSVCNTLYGDGDPGLVKLVDRHEQILKIVRVVVCALIVALIGLTVERLVLQDRSAVREMREDLQRIEKYLATPE